MKTDKTGDQRWHRRRFFKFLDAEPAGIIEDGKFVAFDQQEPPLMIYGYESDSAYRDDHEYIDECIANGWVPGEWFSEACPEGEFGDQRGEKLIEITEDEFNEAQRRGWPPKAGEAFDN